MCETVLQRGWENYREFLEVDIRAKAFARTVREKVILECQWQCAHEQGLVQQKAVVTGAEVQVRQSSQLGTALGLFFLSLVDYSSQHKHACGLFGILRGALTIVVSCLWNRMSFMLYEVFVGLLPCFPTDQGHPLFAHLL